MWGEYYRVEGGMGCFVVSLYAPASQQGEQVENINFKALKIRGNTDAEPCPDLPVLVPRMSAPLL